MKDIIETLERWTDAGAAVALGSVVERIGSAPRNPGATLAVSGTGEVAGGVTGGCVEPSVIQEARAVLAGSRGRLVHYGLGEEEGFDSGLICGGRIAVAVYRLDPALVAPVAAALRADRAIAVTLSLDEADFGRQAIVAADGGDGDDDPLATAARPLLELGECGIVETPAGEKLFVEPYLPRPDLYLFGASDHVAALVPLGKSLGYRVTVCDPRRAFLTRERFPTADALSDDWPDGFLAHAPIDARTAICVMTHDRKLDLPALELALASDAGFIGAMGSETTRFERNGKLREAGFGEADLARLHAPIGIQIGARTPEEVAVTIAAELIQANVSAQASRTMTVARATVLS